MTAARTGGTLTSGEVTTTRPDGGRPAGTSAPRGGTSAGGRFAARWRRWRAPAAVAGVVLAGAVLTVVATGSPGAGTLDPEAAGPDGARALARVLVREGVDVQRVTRLDAAAGAAGPGSTVLVVDAEVLAPSGLRRLAGTGADLVLVRPDGAALDALAVPVAPAGTSDAATVDAACDDPDARAAGRTTGGGSLLRATGPGATVCFPEAGAGEEPGRGASYAVADLPAGGGTLRVLGQPDVLTNSGVLTAGNAALALRVLGAEPTLVWLMASPLDAAAEQPSPQELLPGWVAPVAVQLAVVTLLAGLWQGRRLGRLVPEPLPVVVRSAETAEGRAALYRRAGATDRAATVLRAAAMTRLARRLGVPPGADAATVVLAVASAVGRSRADVGALLTGAPAPPMQQPPQQQSPQQQPKQPMHDRRDAARALVRLADDLDALEAAVSAAPAAPHDARETENP